jgi:hypothetical protein
VKKIAVIGTTEIKDWQCTCNVTLMRVRVTVVAVELLRLIMFSVACPAVQNFSTVSHWGGGGGI